MALSPFARRVAFGGLLGAAVAAVVLALLAWLLAWSGPEWWLGGALVALVVVLVAEVVLAILDRSSPADAEFEL